MLLIISTSIAHGPARGIQTVAGTSSAMIIQLAIAALGAAWFVEALAHGFEYLKWCGVAYLFYLGINHFYRAYSVKPAKPEPSTRGTFARGFWVSLTNPKTILFFTAFLPQFVVPSGSFLPQIGLLSLSFLILATLLDSCYAILAGKLQVLLKSERLSRVQNCISGTLFLSASAWLASVRQT